MLLTDLGEPCRNYNILAVARIRDPRDKRLKVVLSSYVAEGTGCLVVVDPTTGQGEQIALPADSGAWALLNLDDRRLLVGTCATYGYLLVLDMASRTWAEPLRVEGETYIWQLTLGSDGRVYGGTWPGCSLLRYDPDAHRLVNLGKASDVAANNYSRNLCGDVPGKIIVSCGFAEHHLGVYDIATAAFSRLGRVGESLLGVYAGMLCTRVGDERFYYRLPDLTLAAGSVAVAFPAPPVLPYASEFSHYVELEDHTLFAVRGQSYYLLHPGKANPALQPIPTQPPTTAILGLSAAPDGTVWGSSAFGQTIFRYDPASRASWNSEVVCNQGGEVYGMAWLNDRLFMSSYSHGDHIVYDPRQPWDQLNNRNSTTLHSASPELVRPDARSVVGPDGAFYSGWWAAYGVYGGGITRVDPNSYQVTTWYDIVPRESVVGLVADDQLLYMVTTQRANGLPEHAERGHLVAWHPERGIVDQRELEGFIPDWGVCSGPAGTFLVFGNCLYRYLPGQAPEHLLALPEQSSYMLPLPDGRLLICGQRTAWLLTGAQADLTACADLPARTNCAVQGVDGTIYIACGAHLFRLDF